VELAAAADWDERPGLLESAWRYRRLLVLLVLGGLLLGLGLSLAQPKLYEGVAHVLLIPPGGDTGLDPSRYVLNQNELITSQTVLERAVRIAGDQVSLERLQDHLTTETATDRDLIVIRVLDRTPARAARLADAVARGYVQVVDEQARAEVDQLTAAQRRLSENLADVQRAQKARPGDVVLAAQRRAIQDQLTGVSTRLQAVETGTGATTGRVQLRETLRPSRQPVQPKTARNVAAGALVGLGLAIALAWWLNGRTESRVQDSEEVSRLLMLPLLARLPVPAARRRRGGVPRPVMLDDPETVEAEAFRFLRNSFSAAVRHTDARVVMVTSATEQEGKSIVTVNLALALARAGMRVALVELDLRRPVQRRLLELEEGPGFTEVALGRVRLERALHRLVLVNTERGGRQEHNGQGRESGFVEVLAAGARPRSVGEFVGNPSTAEVLERLKQRVDVMLIDAPPMLRVGDTLALVPMVDGLLVVTRMKVARRKSLLELRRLLDTVNVRLLGVVVNGVDPEDTYTGPYGLPSKPAQTVTRTVDSTEGRAGGSPRSTSGER